MDFLPDYDTTTAWLLQHGNFALFFLLFIGIVAFPIPQETLMVVTGTLMAEGKISILPAMLTAYSAAICGISLSYLLGRWLGLYFFQKHGYWFGITKSEIATTKNWFKRFGKWVLFIGYFIPGVRHFTGVFVGMSHVEYKQFALFAYTGAILWTTTFLSLGYFVGDYFISYLKNVEVKTDMIVIIIVAICILAYYFYDRKSKKGSKKPPKI